MDDTQLTQVDTEGGNTKTPSKKGRKYIFTLNNYLENEVDTIKSFLTQKTLKYVFGYEVGESGTPHLQGYMEFKNAIRFDTLKKVNDRWHLEIARGNVNDNFNYCSKEGNYEYKGIEIPYIQELPELYDWEKAIVEDILEKEPDDRSIWWFWEPNGTKGKTTFQKWIVTHYEKVLAISGCAKDMKNAIITMKKEQGFLPETVIMNIPKNRDMYKISYDGIEEIKDMMFYSGKYEGGMVVGKCPRFIVFANNPPIFEKMSADRWRVIRL